MIGKLFIESLDPSNGSYTNESPIFELNLSLASEHEIISTSSHQVDIRYVFNEVEMNEQSNLYCLILSDYNEKITIIYI